MIPLFLQKNKYLKSFLKFFRNIKATTFETTPNEDLLQNTNAIPAPQPSLDDLRKAVERSTSANRNYFISFLVILLYLLIIVASTTDYQLLIPNSNVRLPFVDTQVSLFVFYITAPLIVLAAHFNLLQNLESHHNKLVTWRSAYQGQPVPRALIEPFLYDYAVLEVDGELTKPVRFFARILFLFLAPIALLTFLWRFSDYQSMGITAWHFAVLALDLLIVAYFQRAILGRWQIPTVGWGVLMLAIIQTTLVGLVTQDKGTFVWQTEKRILAWQPIKSMTSALLPRISIDPYTSLTLDDKPLKMQMAYENETNFAKWFKEKGQGLDLRGRSLRGASLAFADLRKAWLQRAKLDGAYLSDANLQGANLRDATLQLAKLDSTNLHGADVYNADLRDARLYNAKLEGASLLYANLKGANLTSANLYGANLDNAELQGAILNRTELQGATLVNANLQGADLRNANLQGADLRDAKLQGADLQYTKLQGANLRDVKLQGAYLKYTEVFGIQFIYYSKIVTPHFVKLLAPVDFIKEANWRELKVMTDDKKFHERISDAIKRTGEFKLPANENPWFIDDNNALAKALPEICTNGLEAIKGSLKNADNSKDQFSAALAWKRLPDVPECKSHLAEIEQWAKSEYSEEWQKKHFPLQKNMPPTTQQPICTLMGWFSNKS